ncbi:MAG: cytochrome c oxidase, subunit [Bacteroidetes bacterium]|nr:cytochrome c oxidase, subunit [Bacteroidota bacterium]
MSSFPLFPDQASVSAQRVDAVYFGLLAISAFFALLIFILLIYFAIKYRRGRTVDRVIRRTDYLKLEMTWIIIPLLISFGIFGWAAKVYFDLKTPPGDALEIYVVGKQWMWKIQHPNGVRENNELHVPLGRTVKLTMTSQDVIHSFFIPAFRIKQDVLPGRYTSQWFQATKVGEYHLFCAEYCGTSHSGMIGKIVVMNPPEYERWLLQGVARESMAVSGELLYGKLSCGTCHKSGGRGPDLAGLFNSQVNLEGGAVVTADRAYIRESIINPMVKIVQGYPRLMPTYRTQLTEDQVNEVIEYIKTMGGGQETALRSVE